VQRIRSAGGTAIGVRCDRLGRSFGGCDVRPRKNAEYGHVDILVNDAYAPLTRLVPEAYELDAWERSIRVNLTALLPMCARGGRG